MHEEKKRLPVGVENFEQLIKDRFYYVDKTGLISELLRNGGMVNLFTRPRRFGKTLNMSMLESFFSIESDKTIFDGLDILKDQTICDEYMGKHPVIFISLKGINAESYETAFRLAVETIKGAAKQVKYLKTSSRLDEDEREEYKMLLNRDMDDVTLFLSLKTLSELLEKHYGEKIILLIDEYDVPLAKAYENGYYDRMVFLIRNLLEQALKTNNSLKLAVLTGCMCITKENIFTGLNNFTTFTITDVDFDEYFGFTDEEVRQLLAYYEREGKYLSVKEWYDGYRFGNVDVYCPWDVVSYLRSLRTSADVLPQNYWANTSGNAEVKEFIRLSDHATIKHEIECLMSGESITKQVRPELNYRDMYQSPENIWSVLFMTGYLTQTEQVEQGRYRLRVPNKEIQNIFAMQIQEYSDETIRKDGELLRGFCSGYQIKSSDEKIGCSDIKRNVYVVKDIDDNQIVVINDICFKGRQNINWEEVEQYLKQYVGELIEIAENKEIIYIGKELPDEYAGSRYTAKLRGTLAKAKANAAQGIPEIIEIATNKRFQKNLAKKHNRNARFGWYRYDSRFALPIYNDRGDILRYNIFHAELVIRHAENKKMYLYDIINIKKETSTPLEQ